jgi:DNA polymerase-3 subunit gamma/tau
VDVQEIDAASNNGVDNVRDLRESTRFNPARDRYRIWVIDEVHMLSPAAFNAFLKTLEEPPPRVKFIFATTELQKLPETILSRCQIYAFRLIPAKTRPPTCAPSRTREDRGLTPLCSGSREPLQAARTPLSLRSGVRLHRRERQDEDVARPYRPELLREATRAVFENDSAGVLRVIETLASYGVDYPAFSHELLLYWRTCWS